MNNGIYWLKVYVTNSIKQGIREEADKVQNLLAIIPYKEGSNSFSPEYPIYMPTANNLSGLSVIILDDHYRDVDFGGQEVRLTIQ